MRFFPGKRCTPLPWAAWACMSSRNGQGFAQLARRKHDVHVFYAARCGHQPHYALIEGVHYHRCDFELNPNFVDEINNMCRVFVQACFDEEDKDGAFDIVHAHDWLASNAVVWIKQGRPRKAVLSMHSTEYGRNGNKFFGGQAQRVAEHERGGTHAVDHVIAVSNLLKEEVTWLGYQVPILKKSRRFTTASNSIVFDKHVDVEAVKRQLRH